MSGKKYTYGGNRDSNNTAGGINYHAPVEDGEDPKWQGEVRPEFGPLPIILVGEKITLSAAERDRLSPIVLLTDGEDEDVAPGILASTATPPVIPPETDGENASDTTKASEDTGNLQGKSSSSKTRTN